MPRIIVTRTAQRDFERLRQFLQKKNPDASRRVARAIKDALTSVIEQPEAHRPVPDMMFHREVIIPYGSTGYIARYYFKPGTKDIIILRVKHQREDEFDGSD
jgi:plasmid stabilization system protein ParE